MSSVIISGDTSGAITLAAPAVAGTNTATLPATTGTVMVSGNMPAFSAYADTAQTISSATLTKVTFGTEEFDTNSNFASSRFTPTVAGYYQFNATILCKASSTLTFAGLSFYKNGSNAIRTLNVPIASFSEPSISASCLLYLNGSTDYVEVYGSITGTGTITFGFNDSAITSRFTGSMVRAA
jgi:hypothetical protein